MMPLLCVPYTLSPWDTGPDPPPEPPGSAAQRKDGILMPRGESEYRGARIEVRSLVKRFGLITAVDDLSFVAEPGGFLTLLGPSGSGKTTTLNIIAGFESADAGEILLDSQSISSVPTYKRNIGVVFQNYALFPHLTVAQNIAYPLRMRRMKSSEIQGRVSRALEMVRLGGYQNRYPRQLSGGQQQRVAIARAIVFNPPLLLMDEPLGALDKKLREQMQIEIKRIQGRLGITVIYVTHDQEEALILSDKIVILNEGRLQQMGPPREIYDMPRNRFVADFIGETNITHGELRDHNGGLLLELPELGARLELPPEEPVSRGRILVSIRPEMLWLESGNPEQPGPCGRIEEIIYVGESTKYLVRILEKEVVVRQPRRTDPGGYRKGDRVQVLFNPQDLVFVEPKEG